LWRFARREGSGPGVSAITPGRKRFGYEILSINDSKLSEQALGQIKPTVIFMDMTMPGRDGMALIGSLASSNYPGKVVIMSGADLSDVKTRSTEIRSLTLSAVVIEALQKADRC
jgi:DNA-binding NarL/FixJ family response regulator